MAITKIHPIKFTLHLAIAYITDEIKTDEKILVSTHKCHEASAHTQFLRTRENPVQKELFLQDISFSRSCREKPHLKWLTKLVLRYVRRS